MVFFVGFIACTQLGGERPRIAGWVLIGSFSLAASMGVLAAATSSNDSVSFAMFQVHTKGWYETHGNERVRILAACADENVWQAHSGECQHATSAVTSIEDSANRSRADAAVREAWTSATGSENGRK